MTGRAVWGCLCLIAAVSMGAVGCSSSDGAAATGSEIEVPIPVLLAFSADPASGIAPFPVLFTNESVVLEATEESYVWLFGDGGTSEEENPIYRYRFPGEYTVSLFVNTDVGSFRKKEIDLIHVAPSGPAPIVDFSASPVQGGRGLEVQFTNLTDLGGAPDVRYRWVFGDGQTSDEENPTHVYKELGTYTVALEVLSTGGFATSLKPDLIEVFDAPGVDFEAAPTTGVVPFNVQFTDLSDLKDAPSATYMWNFGDGKTSTAQNPLHTYTFPGTYDVTLTVTTISGTRALRRNELIVAVPPPPIADFSASPTSGEASLDVQFTNLSNLRGGSNPVYLWDFGDGFTSDERDPLHTYRLAGSYTVSLTVTTNGGVDTLTRPDMVNVDRRTLSSDGDYMLVFQMQISSTIISTLLYISSAVETEAVVSAPAIGFAQTFPVAPGVVTEIEIPFATLVDEVDSIVTKGVAVLSPDDISVYGLSAQGASTDGFVAFPKGALGTEYYAVSYTHSPRLANVGGPQFAVVAVKDNTNVTVTPVESSGSRVAGVPFTVTLDAFQVYQLRTTEEFTDLTGSRILADKPVALFSGNQCADIPEDTGACDYMVEQIPPVHTWGTSVITVPLAGRSGGDRIRVLAARNGTNITFTEGASTETVVLNAGEFFERLVENIARFDADQPILVAQFSNSLAFDNDAFDSDANGDPFIMLAIPIERFLSSYTFPIPDIEGRIRVDFINVVARSADASAGNVLLDGAPISPALFSEVPGTAFSAAQVPVEKGSHTLTAPNPVGLYIYGFGFYESYGFPGGMAF